MKKKIFIIMAVVLLMLLAFISLSFDDAQKAGMYFSAYLAVALTVGTHIVNDKTVETLLLLGALIFILLALII